MSGAATPHLGGVIIHFSRMARILEVDIDNQLVVVEPGVPNIQVSEALKDTIYYYAPDPSSQPVSTIGGNIATNAGGAHTLKYGTTARHVLGLEVVLADGGRVWLGGKVPDRPGYDLLGLMIGSEGTLGVVTRAVLRLTKKAEAVKTLFAAFDSVEDAASSVEAIIGAGIVPTALEFMDRKAVQAVESTVLRAGYPTDAEAVLIVEVDGFAPGVEQAIERCFKILEEHRAREIRVAESEEERAKLWKGRKGAFGVVGLLSPDSYVQDGVIPRTELTAVLKRVEEVARRYRLRIMNVFHAGDGNIHPLILFDRRRPGELERVLEAGYEILKICVEAGGSITGEHGVGLEKKDLMLVMYTGEDLEAMKAVKEVFDPEGILNPGKIFPGDEPPLEESRRLAESPPVWVE